VRIYIFADQEGVAGVFSRHEKYLFAREYATMELAAISEALLKAGVKEILINTLHPLDYHQLPSSVRVLYGLPRHDSFTGEMDSNYDAAFIVGMHEMAGGREKGCWRHTMAPHPITYAYSSVEAVWINDLLVGEIGLFAAFAGIHSVPVALLTGDHWACIEAEELLPGIETVAVKKGTSYFSAVSMTPQDAAEASAAGAVRALGKISKVRPLTIEGTATLKVRYQFAQRATDAMAAVSGCTRIDERTVAVTHPDMATLRDNLGALRAPETDLYQKDISQQATTGLFTRLGGEPFLPQPTRPLPTRS